MFVLTKVHLILYRNLLYMKKCIALILTFVLVAATNAQKIDYSLVDKDDYREMNFEIIGKLGSNIAAKFANEF